MRFSKLHGAGNDFILINNITARLADESLAELARRLCERRLGIGADGLILADRPSAQADVKMVFFNADGSRGEMCGNGARCLARFAYEEGLAPAEMTLETPAGQVLAKRLDVDQYWVRLPNPSLIKSLRLAYRGDVIIADYIELGDPGVPHLAVALPDLAKRPAEELFTMGRELRYHADLAKGANVNFYQLLTPQHYLAKTYERGVEDFTLACGTGSASVALALQQAEPELRDKRLQFSVPGGELFIEADWHLDTVLSVDLIGPSVRVFDGQLLIDSTWESSPSQL